MEGGETLNKRKVVNHRPIGHEETCNYLDDRWMEKQRWDRIKLKLPFLEGELKKKRPP